MTQEICRFITCGSVDDGKSTLIGRLLYDTKAIFDDQLSALKKDSKALGTQGENLDFALLVDGLSSEREQGITIDVAYRFFNTKKRKFIIADTPGHEQYTRNMATGASTSDIAILLIDACKGLLTQTRRHSYIVHLLGVQHFIIAVNKMDRIAYSKSAFEAICYAYRTSILEQLGDDIQAHFIPISALKGDNIVHKSENLAWYKGESLLTLLENIELDSSSKAQDSFILPVQYINRPNSDFRAFCGQVASGKCKLGDEIVILPSMQHTKIAKIITQDCTSAKEAFSGMSISVCLENECDVSRGDCIASTNHALRVTNTFSAMIIAFAPLEPQTHYLIKLAHNLCGAQILSIDYKKDVNTFNNLSATSLRVNDIAKCTLRVQKPIPVQCYARNKTMGAFIIIDKYSNQTLGAGMICEVLDSIDSHTPKYDSHAPESSMIESNPHKTYTAGEIALNAFIRANYPEWGCKEI